MHFFVAAFAVLGSAIYLCSTPVLEKTLKMLKLPRARIVAYYGDDAPLVLPKQRDSDVRVVLVSDTHNVIIDPSLFPEGDLLLHAGDHTIDGQKEELKQAARWLHTVALRYKYGCVTVGGNHDKPLDTESDGMARDWLEGDSKVTLLRHESINIAGLNIFASPYVPLTPKRHKMAFDDPERYHGFNRDDPTLAALYAKIPTNTDILMTHTPPFAVLDDSLMYSGKRREKPVQIGSKVLREWWNKCSEGFRPALHVFGHEHDSRGLRADRELGVLFCNAASVDGDRGAGGYKLKPNFRATVVDFRIE